jgi:hypothetical protein
VTKERLEIIVALVPRIQPYDGQYQAFEQGEIVKASVPLLHGPLCRTDRPWDPILPDGKRIQYPLLPQKHPRPKTGYYHDEMPQYEIPNYPLPQQHFYSDAVECESAGPQMAEPQATDPFTSDQDLPLPSVENGASAGMHVISDQPTMPNRTSGAKP